MSSAGAEDAANQLEWGAVGLLHVGPEPSNGVRWWEGRFGPVEALALCDGEDSALAARRLGMPALSGTLRSHSLEGAVPVVLLYEVLHHAEGLAGAERLLQDAATAARDAVVVVHGAPHPDEPGAHAVPRVGALCQALNRLGLSPYAYAPLPSDPAFRAAGRHHVIVVPTRPLDRGAWTQLFDRARGAPLDAPLEELLAAERAVSFVTDAGAPREPHGRADVEVTLTHPAAPVLLPEPVSVTGAIADVSRLAHGYAAPPVTVGLVRGGAVVMSEGCVITSRRELVLESSSRLSFGRELAKRRPDLLAELTAAPHDSDPAPVLVLPNPRRPSYYHWWLDCLPRVWLVDEWTASAGCRLIAPAHLYDFELETLQLLDVAARVERQREPVATYEQVLLSPGVAWRDLPSPAMEAFVAWVRERVNGSLSAEATRRIYVSRASARRRRVVNEAEVCDTLASFGFEAVELDGMAVHDQIALFSGAEAVVAPHGAGLTNIMFCRGGAHVMELFSVGGFHDSCYRRMAAISGLHYHAVVGHSGQGADGGADHGKRTHQEDMTIDVTALGEAVESALAGDRPSVG